MPTGYTATLAETDQPFEEFVLQCARAFGACVHLRDAPADAKVTLSEDNYHFNNIGRLTSKMQQFNTFTIGEQLSYGEKCKREEIQYLTEKKVKQLATKQRYLAMLNEVNSWTPPTDSHTALKSFMLEQLNSSLRSDVDIGYYDNALEQANNKDPIAYYTEEVSQINQEIAYHVAQANKQSSRTANSNQWIIDLYKSLNLPVPTK